MFNKKLAQQLPSLPLELESKIHLWLAYRGLKPVSTIHLEKNSKMTPKLEVWLREAKLHHAPDQTSPRLFFVSQDKAKAQRAAAIMWSETPADLKEKGILFGYPKAAVAAFAKGQPLKGLLPRNWDKYWAAYVRYAVRPGHELEDSRVAKTWADTIRADLPAIAKKYEHTLSQAEFK